MEINTHKKHCWGNSPVLVARLPSRRMNGLKDFRTNSDIVMVSSYITDKDWRERKKKP